LFKDLVVAHPESEDDRVALAEMYLLEGDLGRARAELREVLDRNIRNAPAYRVLMRLYERSAQGERASRVAGMLKLLGYGDLGEKTVRTFVAQTRRGVISQ